MKPAPQLPPSYISKPSIKGVRVIDFDLLAQQGFGGHTHLTLQRFRMPPGSDTVFHAKRLMAEINDSDPVDSKVWSDAQMLNMSRQAVVRVESEAARGLRQLPAEGKSVQTDIEGVPFLVKNDKGKFYAFPGKK